MKKFLTIQSLHLKAFANILIVASVLFFFAQNASASIIYSQTDDSSSVTFSDSAYHVVGSFTVTGADVIDPYLAVYDWASNSTTPYQIRIGFCQWNMDNTSTTKPSVPNQYTPDIGCTLTEAHGYYDINMVTNGVADYYLATNAGDTQPYYLMCDSLPCEEEPPPSSSLQYPYVPLSPLEDDILPNNFGFVGKINNQGGAWSMKLKVWGVTDIGYEEEKTFLIPQIANPYFITYTQIWDFLEEGDYEYSWRFCTETDVCTDYWYEVTSTDRIHFSIEENATTPFPVLGGDIEVCGDYDVFCNLKNFLNDTLARIQSMFVSLQIYLTGLWQNDFLSNFFPLNILLELNEIFTQTITGSEHLSLELDTGGFGEISVLSTESAETWIGSTAVNSMRTLIGYSLWLGLFWFIYETLHKVFIRLTHAKHE